MPLSRDSLEEVPEIWSDLDAGRDGERIPEHVIESCVLITGFKADQCDLPSTIGGVAPASAQSFAASGNPPLSHTARVITFLFSRKVPLVLVTFAAAWIPAADLKGGQPSRLTPMFEIEGRTVMLLPLQMAAIPLRELGAQPLRMLTEGEAYAVSSALGVLFEGV